MQANESFRKDVYEDTILFSFLYWLELKEEEMFISSLNSAKRYFNIQRESLNQSYQYEFQIINLLKGIKDLNDKVALEASYPKIETVILMASRQPGINNYAEHLFTILFWARSRRLKSDYFTEAAGWYNKHIINKIR